jgi:uncharacterized protein with PIN domain
MTTPPQFACDVMLGRTARWLRMLGFDTFYDNRAGDDDLKELCLREKRVLLTKDAGLHRLMPAGASLLVAAVQLRPQLEEIVGFFHLGRFALPRRCSLCNGELDLVDKGSLENLVPPYVYRTQSSFQRCRRCQKVYWPGTHLARIKLFVADMGMPAER